MPNASYRRDCGSKKETVARADRAAGALRLREKTLAAVRGVLACVLLAAAACQGSWAEQTVVVLNPLTNSTIKGLAVVSLGRACDDSGKCRSQGSYIYSQITSRKTVLIYRFILAKGSCGQPPTDGVELARGSAEDLNAQPFRAHVDTPILALTNGDYVIIVQARERKAVACGVIRRDGSV